MSKKAQHRCGGGRMVLWVMPVALHVVERVAHAQTPARIPDEDGGLLQWGVALGIAVLVVLTGFLNPKRSHRH